MFDTQGESALSKELAKKAKKRASQGTKRSSRGGKRGSAAGTRSSLGGTRSSQTGEDVAAGWAVKEEDGGGGGGMSSVANPLRAQQPPAAVAVKPNAKRVSMPDMEEGGGGGKGGGSGGGGKEKKKGVRSSLAKMRKSMAKPFQKGWRPRSTTLCLLPHETRGQYARRNKWFLVWLALALLGLALALAAYLAPCEPILTSFTAPSEMMVVLDGSGSITTAGWPTEVRAAKTFVQAFGTNSTLAAGAVQFSGQRVTGSPGGSSADAARVEIPLQPNSTRLYAEFDKLATVARFATGGTYIAPGLILAYEALANATAARAAAPPPTGLAAFVPDPFQAILVLSDGSNSDANGYGPNDASGTYAFCQKHGLDGTCTVPAISAFIKGQGILVKGVFVGNSVGGQRSLCNSTSCVQAQCTNATKIGGACQLFTEVTNLATLQAVASKLSSNLQLLVPSGLRETGCADARWFALLLLGLPLLWYLLFLPCLNAWNRVLDEREKWTRQEMELAASYLGVSMSDYMEAHADDEPATVSKRFSMSSRTSNAVRLQPSAVGGAGGPIGKRFKWKIEAADRYLWAMGGAGNAPMRVNFGEGKAPPSAPKQHADKKERVEAKLYEMSDYEIQQRDEAAALKRKADKDAGRQERAAKWVEEENERRRLAAEAEKRDNRQRPDHGFADTVAFFCRMCCRGCLGCLAKFINDLAHFVAFYCPRCIGFCIEDDYEARLSALNEEKRGAETAGRPTTPMQTPSAAAPGAKPKPAAADIETGERSVI
jgi:hypothetical protein